MDMKLQSSSKNNHPGDDESGSTASSAENCAAWGGKVAAKVLFSGTAQQAAIFDTPRAAPVQGPRTQVLMLTASALLGAGVAHLLGRQPGLAARLVVASPSTLVHCAALLERHPPKLLIVDSAAGAHWRDAAALAAPQAALLWLAHGAAEPPPAHACRIELQGPLREVDAALRKALAPCQAPVAERSEALTPRRREVMELLRTGLSNKEIARHMNLAPGTVKLHVAAVLRALNARNRLQLIVRQSVLTVADPEPHGLPALPAPAVASQGVHS
jgi:DNA-binding NarL/FixJ family response regulator